MSCSGHAKFCGAQNRFAELSMDETLLGQHEQLREAGVVGDEVEVCPATTDGAQSAQAADACGLRATPAGTCGLGTDRFFSLATDSDEEQSREPRETIVDHSGSDTQSVPAIRNRRRSLRLRWNSATEPSGNCDAILVSDRDVRAAVHLLDQLSVRVGAIPVGGELPRALRQQRWSPISVPLIWAAAGRDDCCPVLQWLMGRAQVVQEPVNVHGFEVSPSEALRLGWDSLRNVLRRWGVTTREGLSDWLGENRFPRTAPGNHISARAQDHIFGEASRMDARVSLLEAVFVLIAIQMGREVSVRPHTETVPTAPAGMPQEITRATWEQLDEVNVSEMFEMRVPMLKSCPRFLRGRLRFSFFVALRERLRCKLDQDMQGENRAWKLFALVPMLLLHRPKHVGSVGRDELAKRADRLVRGHGLIAEVRSCTSRTCPVPKNDADDHMRRGLAAQSRVQRGQVSRARHELTGAALAPKDEITLAELRSRRPQSRAHDIPQAIIDYIPESPLQLDAKIFAKCLQTAPSGSAPGPGGCTNEMLRVCLDDVETLSLLISAAEDFARAETPPAAQSFMLATMTALRKKDGGVRGIATGSSFRRLVAKTLAKQFSTAVNDTCAPFQFALRRAQASIASGTRSDLPRTRTRKPQCCLSTELVRTTMCPEVP